MSKVGNAIDKVRTKLAIKSEKFLADICDIYGPQFTDGGASGDSLALALVAEDVPCSYKPASPGSQVVVGGEAYVGSHVLQLPWLDYTVEITPRHQIRIQPRGDVPEMIFESPAIIPSSLSVFVFLQAKFVHQGYQ